MLGKERKLSKSNDVLELKPTNSIEVMHSMLTYRRPHRSKTERKFIQEFISGLGVKHDRYGNRFLRIGDAPIMYSCHTDSVHRNPGRQPVVADAKNMKFSLHPDAGVMSNCLGADNAAGIWVMREMILAKKPGLYIFHRGEECGGLGSKWITKQTPLVVQGIKAAIAFDRRNTKSIITFQWGGRCCSNAFADSLAAELKLGHSKDMGGSFTDTANYTDLIPECTNVSVGFDNEHCTSETLDVQYLTELRQAMLELNYDNLVFERKAGEKEPRTYYYHYEYMDGETSGYAYKKPYSYSSKQYDERTKHWWQKDDVKKFPTYTYKNGKFARYEEEAANKPIGFLEDKSQKELPLETEEEKAEARVLQKQRAESLISKMVKANPFIIALLLEDAGETLDSVADYIYKYDGHIPAEVMLEVNRELRKR